MKTYTCLGMSTKVILMHMVIYSPSYKTYTIFSVLGLYFCFSSSLIFVFSILMIMLSAE